MKIIGIETSHDDTSIAILDNHIVTELITYSQYELHRKYGGVIPELASREHVNNIALVLDQLLQKDALKDVDYIAYTNKPGLIGPLHMGRLFAYALSFALCAPLIAINHLTGHIYSGAIDNEIKYPAVALLASGGHTQLLLVNSIYDIKLLGQTQDDAVGEAFDKVGRVLGLKFPGGPEIDKIYNPHHVLNFKVSMLDKSYNFSYSGLKSKVINYIHNQKQRNNPLDLVEIASAFQTSAIQQLLNKTKMAITEFKPNSLILGGGVSANSLLRKEIKKLHLNAIIPNLKYATDNGAMIAKAAQVMIDNQK